MAQKVQILLTDDLTGEDAQETVRFGLDGSNYEIDLTTDNASKLREALSVYTDKGRKAGRAGSQPMPGVRARRGDVQKIRQWAQENGYTVSGRGRISAQIRDAYAAAHKDV